MIFFFIFFIFHTESEANRSEGEAPQLLQKEPKKLVTLYIPSIDVII